jgi:hypothetical protein
MHGLSSTAHALNVNQPRPLSSRHTLCKSSIECAGRRRLNFPGRREVSIHVTVPIFRAAATASMCDLPISIYSERPLASYVPELLSLVRGDSGKFGRGPMP